jgi:hypothetical protein
MSNTFIYNGEKHLYYCDLYKRLNSKILRIDVIILDLYNYLFDMQTIDYY